MPGLDQVVDRGRADLAAGAGDEDLHSRESYQFRATRASPPTASSTRRRSAPTEWRRCAAYRSCSPPSRLLDPCRPHRPRRHARNWNSIRAGGGRRRRRARPRSTTAASTASAPLTGAQLARRARRPGDADERPAGRGAGTSAATVSVTAFDARLVGAARPHRRRRPRPGRGPPRRAEPAARLRHRGRRPLPRSAHEPPGRRRRARALPVGADHPRRGRALASRRSSTAATGPSRTPARSSAPSRSRPTTRDREARRCASRSRRSACPTSGAARPTRTSSTFGYQAHGGYDCSGFVWRVFKLSGNPAGARIGGRTAAQMAGEIRKSRAHPPRGRRARRPDLLRQRALQRQGDRGQRRPRRDRALASTG